MNWVLIAGVESLFFDTVGLVVGLFVWRRLSRGQRTMAFWFAVSVITDVANFIVGRTMHTTRPVVRVWYAASVVVALAAMATYQGSARRARLFWAASAAYVALWVILLFTVESMMKYPPYSAPIHALLILAAAVMTLFRRVAVARGDLMRDAGFLFAVGLIAYAVPTSIQALVPQVADLSTTFAYYALTDVISLAATLLIIAGLIVSPGSGVERPR